MAGIHIDHNDNKTTTFTFNNGSLEVIIRNGDISKEKCDVIVNPTNVSMVPNGGLDHLIHESMGQFFTDQVVAIHKKMQENSCPVGQSRIFISKFEPEENDARFVISTVGPNYSEAEKERAGFLLQSCYYTSLALANLYQLSSISYPAISCGANNYPTHEAARVAIDSIIQYSYNVKSVHFVLYERTTYDIFVREWTDFAERVNADANINDQMSEATSEPPPKSTISPPVSPEPSARYCVLCKGQQLSIDRQLLCFDCGDLSRRDVFIHFLTRLRAAAEKSFDELRHECELLKPILKSYPLAYTPVKSFDQSIHTRDPVAEHYLQNHCDKDVRNFMPMSIIGDGNCFYNTFVRLGGAGTMTDASALTPIELRARNVVELALNIDAYKEQYNTLASVLDPFEEYIRKEMVNNASYSSPWDFFSMATLLNITIISIYPKVNGPDDQYYKHINNQIFIPLIDENDTDNQAKTTEASTVLKEVRVLFTHCAKPVPALSKEPKAWMPNHFVPLLKLR